MRLRLQPEIALQRFSFHRLNVKLFVLWHVAPSLWILFRSLVDFWGGGVALEKPHYSSCHQSPSTSHWLPWETRGSEALWKNPLENGKGGCLANVFSSREFCTVKCLFNTWCILFQAKIFLNFFLWLSRPLLVHFYLYVSGLLKKIIKKVKFNLVDFRTYLQIQLPRVVMCIIFHLIMR